jgi:hypothetical protein
VWCIVPPSMALTVNTAGSPPKKAADVANGTQRVGVPPIRKWVSVPMKWPSSL